jgi:PmbA protein
VSVPTATARASGTFDPAAAEQELLVRCDRLVERSLALGADEAEACAAHWRSITVRFEKGDLKLAQVDRGTTLGLRVFRGGRLGFSSTNQAGDRALESCASDALALAKLAPSDPHNVLPESRALGKRLVLLDPAVADLPIERAVEIGHAFVERSRARDARLSIDSAGVDATSVARAIATSRGARASESDAQVSLNVFGMAIDGEDVGGFHYTGDSVRRLADLEAAGDACAREFADVALGNLGAKPAASYSGPVLFAPDAFLELFLAPLVSAASAIAVQRGRSALAGRLGEVIAASLLDIHDDPTDRGLAGASAFDREGEPCGRFAIVEHGVLASFLYNAYAAAVEGRASTGHARGSPRALPGLGPHALAVAPGRGGTRVDLERALGRGLYVQRFSGTVDPASGDFSGVAKSARWIEGGLVTTPVRETLIAGNLFALLPRVAALSSIAERCSGEARVPYALVDGVTVTAG